MWRKTLIYLGLVEDDEYDEYAYNNLAEDEPRHKRDQRRPKARRAERATHERHDEREAVVRPIPSPSLANVHHLSPRDFNAHAQELGDKFRSGSVVIMNLQDTDPEIAGRLKNFASGLVYGLEGVMKKVGDDVYLLSPSGIQVSAEEQRRFLEQSGLFNEA